LDLTVVSDKLSGDDDYRNNSEEILRNLIDPEGEGIPIILTRSPKSDDFIGDLIADNLAGWLNGAISDPCSKSGQHAIQLSHTGIWKGWHELIPSIGSTLESNPALSRLECR
jgi:hypothetical protein